MPKIAEVQLSSCGLEVAGFTKNCDCGITELRLRSNISLKSCGIAIVEVFPSSCGIAIADYVPTSAFVCHKTFYDNRHFVLMFSIFCIP
jgi:hypothetical protein